MTGLGVCRLSRVIAGGIYENVAFPSPVIDYKHNMTPLLYLEQLICGSQLWQASWKIISAQKKAISS